jgi:hypothetical protein
VGLFRFCGSLCAVVRRDFVDRNTDLRQLKVWRRRECPLARKERRLPSVVPPEVDWVK